MPCCISEDIMLLTPYKFSTILCANLINADAAFNFPSVIMFIFGRYPTRKKPRKYLEIIEDLGIYLPETCILISISIGSVTYS